jgi:site-specific recombinase XerD
VTDLAPDPAASSPSGALVAAAHTDLDRTEVGGDRLGRLAAGWLLGYNSRHTRRAYARDLTSWARWCDQLDVDPLHADRVHVDAWDRHLTEALALAPAAIARRLAAVSAFYRWCVLEQHLSTNPAVHARRPEVDPNASTTLGLTPEHARTLLAGAAEHSPRMLALVTLLLIDGLRISEALSLDVDDVQHVDRGHRIVDLRRKGGHAARAALPPLVSDAIDTSLAHRADQGADRDQGADAPAARRGPTGPLFVTRTGARWRPGHAARALTALATHVEIPGATRVTPHALRHAAITLALDAGVPLHEVQDFAGHRDPRYHLPL